MAYHHVVRVQFTDGSVQYNRHTDAYVSNPDYWEYYVSRMNFDHIGKKVQSGK